MKFLLDILIEYIILPVFLGFLLILSSFIAFGGVVVPIPNILLLMVIGRIQLEIISYMFRSVR